MPHGSRKKASDMLFCYNWPHVSEHSTAFHHIACQNVQPVVHLLLKNIEFYLFAGQNATTVACIKLYSGES